MVVLVHGTAGQSIVQWNGGSNGLRPGPGSESSVAGKPSPGRPRDLPLPGFQVCAEQPCRLEVV